MVRYSRYGLLLFLAPLFFTCDMLTNFIISDEDEISLGQKFSAQISADSVTYRHYTKDTAIINYIRRMGQAIADVQNDRRNVPFSFTIIDDTVVNAFSLPGGPVYIYKGLLKKAGSGAEIAGVLAHEIGHITMRHGARKMAEMYGVQIVNQILFGSDSSAAATIASLLAGMAFLKVGRDNEYEADSCGVAYSVSARYNPYGMKNFFQTLSSLYGDTPFELLSDHPATSERINNVQRLINKLPTPPLSTDTTGLHIGEYAALQPRI
jgi:beta-barrel assembly-enhancing protease